MSRTRALPRLLSALLVLAAPRIAGAEVDAQAWAQIIAQGPLGGPRRGYAEAQLRLNELDRGTEVQALLLRPAIGIALPRGFTVHAGFAWTPTFHPRFNDEQRPWQQLAHTASLGPITFTNRFRVEERILENVDFVALRLRHMVRALWMPPGSSVGVVAWDEVFLEASPPGPGIRGGFAQNRVGVGAQLRPMKALWLEPTFVIQSIDRGGAGATRVGPTGLLLVWINL